MGHVPVFTSVHNGREELVQVGGGADHEDDAEEKLLEVEYCSLGELVVFSQKKLWTAFVP